jgi:hypothetical protein
MQVGAIAYEKFNTFYGENLKSSLNWMFMIMALLNILF